MTTIQMRRDTAANWTTTNPVLASGEHGVETNTGQFKIGNGTTAWNALAYAGGGVGGGSGDVSSNVFTSTSGQLAMFTGTNGKVITPATGNGVVKLVSNVAAIATAGTDYFVPGVGATLLTGAIELGAATGTTITSPSPGLVLVEGKQVPLMDSAAVVNVTTAAIVPVVQNTYIENTGLTGAVTVTATDGQVGWQLWVALTGTAARAITWNTADFENGAFTLTAASTTVGTQRLDAGFIWNTGGSRWRLMSLSSA